MQAHLLARPFSFSLILAALLAAGAFPTPARAADNPKPPLFLPKDQWPPGPIHVSDHEDLLEAFWDMALYDLGATWKPGGDMDSRFQAVKMWNGLAIRESFTATGKNTGSVERDFSLPLDNYDGLIVKTTLTRGQKIVVTAQVSGKDLPPVERAGADVSEEVFVPLPADAGRTLTHLKLAFEPSEPGAANRVAMVYWVLLRKPSPNGTAALPRASAPAEGTPSGAVSYPKEFAANLIFTPEEADAWRKALLQSPAGTKMAQAIEARANKSINYDPTPYTNTPYAPIIDPIQSRIGAVDEGWYDKLQYLATAYLITGDRSYGDAAARLLMAMVHTPYWTTTFIYRVLPGSRGGAPFAEGFYLTAASLAYDWCYGLLTEEQRAEAAQGIYRSGVKQIGDWLQTGDYWRKMNQGSVFNAPMILGALAVQNRVPEAKSYLEYGKANLLENLTLAFDDDGAGYEGIGYWNFLMHVAIDGLGALEHAEPGFLQNATGPWREGMNYVLAMRSTATPPSKFAGENIGDSHFGAAPGTNVLSFYSHYLHNPTARALWWQIYGNAGYVPNDVATLWAALWFDPKPIENVKPEEVAAAPASWFHGVGLVNFRAGDEANLLFLSGPWGRDHGDKNSFLLEAYGERIAVDPGMIAYSDPHSLLMQLSEFHNVVTINNREQDNPGSHREPAATVEAYGSDSRLAVVSSNAGPAYKTATRYVRSVLFLRPNLFFIVDEVGAAAESDIAWRMDTRLPISIDGNVVTLSGAKATAKLYALAPEAVHITQRPIFAEEPNTQQLLLTSRAKDTRLVNLLQAAPAGQTPAAVTVVQGDNAVAVSVPVPEGTAWFVAAKEAGSWKVQDWSGDARCIAFVAANDTPIDAAWVDGTTLAGKRGSISLPTASGTLHPATPPAR